MSSAIINWCQATGTIWLMATSYVSRTVWRCWRGRWALLGWGKTGRCDSTLPLKSENLVSTDGHHPNPPFFAFDFSLPYSSNSQPPNFLSTEGCIWTPPLMDEYIISIRSEVCYAHYWVLVLLGRLKEQEMNSLHWFFWVTARNMAALKDVHHTSF